MAFGTAAWRTVANRLKVLMSFAKEGDIGPKTLSRKPGGDTRWQKFVSCCFEDSRFHVSRP